MKEIIGSEKIKSGFIQVLLVFCLMFISSVPGFAVEYFLAPSPTGNDANDGLSVGQPWATLAHAISVINALDLTADKALLNVASGVYSVSNGELDSVSSYMISNSNVTIKGEGFSTTSINGSGLTAWADGLTISDSMENITITGLEFTGFFGSGIRINPSVNVKIIDCQFLSNAIGCVVQNSSTVDNAPEIIRNTIQGSFSTGIEIRSDSGTANVSPFIAENIISGSTNYGIEMFAMTSTISAQIKKNEISSNGSSGIFINGDLGDVNPLIKGNKIQDNPTGIYITNYNGTSAPVILNNLMINPGAAAHNYAISMNAPMSGGVNPEILFNTMDGAGQTSIGISIQGSMYLAPVIRYNNMTNFSQFGIQKDINLTAPVDVDYNNAYNNTTNNYENVTISDGANNISVDPQYEVDFSIPQGSPCVDAVPQSVGMVEAVDDDIKGASRPRFSSSADLTADYDIGSYEYPYQKFLFTMPVGTGLATDYRLRTVPMMLDTPLLTLFESAFGTYNNENWRVFAYSALTDPAVYVEMNDATFVENFSDWQGKAFWVISRTDTLPLTEQNLDGNLIGNREPFYLYLDQGWNLISLPWPSSTANPDNILLGNIGVDDGFGVYTLTDSLNTATQNWIWDYTATGYVQLSATTDVMVPGIGYWLYVASTNVKVIIPPDNTTVYFSQSKSIGKKNAGSRRAYDTSLTPPEPPGLGLKAEGGNGCFIGTLFFGIVKSGS